MNVRVGYVDELVRYPVKSMAGIASDSVFLGWHGLEGDRRYALRRLNDNGGFPWLSASRLPELLLYRPGGLDEHAGEPLPAHVRTPEGAIVEIGSPQLPNSIAEKFGSPLELMRLKHGTFDEAPVSVINIATMSAICGAAGKPLDSRRFRPNIVLRTDGTEAFEEDRWIGGRLVDTAKQDPEFMKAAVRLNGNFAGVYATVARTGHINVGDPVSLYLKYL